MSIKYTDTLKSVFDQIAAKIRTKFPVGSTNATQRIRPEDMPGLIEAIPQNIGNTSGTYYTNFWDNYLGNKDYNTHQLRKNFDYAFAGMSPGDNLIGWGWNDNNYNPPQTIVPESANYMYYQSAITNLKVIPDFSKCKYFEHTFQLSRISGLNVDFSGLAGLPRTTNSKYHINMPIADMPNLTSLEVTLPENYEDHVVDYLAYNCPKLETIKVNGYITKKSNDTNILIRLEKSTKLRDYVYGHLIEQLKPREDESMNTATIRFSRAAVENTFGGVNSTGWRAVLQKLPARWSITLV